MQDLSDQAQGLVGYDPSLCVVRIELYLDQDRLNDPYRFGTAIRFRCQLRAVHALDQREAAGDVFGLVRLEMADKVPADVGWQLIELISHFLIVILAQIRNSCFDCFADAVDGDRLGYGE